MGRASTRKKVVKDAQGAPLAGDQAPGAARVAAGGDKPSYEALEAALVQRDAVLRSLRRYLVKLSAELGEVVG